MSTNITYEQFESSCKKYEMTINEGYRAICFASSIINQKLSNTAVYSHEINTNPKYSDEFKRLVKKWKENAIRLSVDFSQLDSEIYNMLEKHDDGNR